MMNGEDPDCLDLHASDEEDLSLTEEELTDEMDAGEELLLLEENTPLPEERSGSPMIPDTLISSEDDLMGDDVPEMSNSKQREMETPPLVENPTMSQKKIKKEPVMPPPQDNSVVTISDSESNSDDSEIPSSRIHGIRSTDPEDPDTDLSLMDSVVSEKSQSSGLKAVRRRFANAKLRKAKMQNENLQENGENLMRSETEREPLFRAGAVEKRTIARARRISSAAESITGELQLGLRQLDFSESGKQKTRSSNGNSVSSEDGMTETVNFPVCPIDGELDSCVKSEITDNGTISTVDENSLLRKCEKLRHRIDGVQTFGDFQFSHESLKNFHFSRDAEENKKALESFYEKTVREKEKEIGEKYESLIDQIQLMKDMEQKKLRHHADLAMTMLLHQTGPVASFTSIQAELQTSKEAIEEAQRSPDMIWDLMKEYDALKKTIDTCRTKFSEYREILTRKIGEIAQSKIVSNKSVVSDKPIFSIQFHSPPASKKRRSSSFLEPESINLLSDSDEPQSSDFFPETMPSRQNKRIRLVKGDSYKSAVEKEKENSEKRNSRKSKKHDSRARRRKEAYPERHEFSTDDQEFGKSSRRITLNKKFLDRLGDHMTIENPRQSRSQERSENSRRERSPPRDSRRRNSSGTETSRRSRRRSGPAASEPAGFSSAAAVTLKEDDKVSKNRVDFRQVDKSRARYMGLSAGQDHQKQLLVVDIKECEVLYVGAGGNNESVRVFRDFPACEKPDAPASACIIDSAEFPNMLAVLARDGIRLLKMDEIKDSVGFSEVVRYPIQFQPDNQIGKHTFAYVGLETCEFDGKQCLVSFNKNLCQLEYFELLSSRSDQAKATVGAFKKIQLSRDFQHTLYMSKSWNGDHLLLSVNDLFNPLVARVTFSGEPDITWHEDGRVRVPKSAIDLLAGICETPNGTLLICDGNKNKNPKFGRVWAVLESKEYSKAGEFVPVKLEDVKGRDIAVRRAVDIVCNKKNVFLCTHPLSSPDSGLRTEAELYAFRCPTEF